MDTNNKYYKVVKPEIESVIMKKLDDFMNANLMTLKPDDFTVEVDTILPKTETSDDGSTTINLVKFTLKYLWMK